MRLLVDEGTARWADFVAAYDEAIAETSTAWAPWYVVPADRKWVRDTIVAQLLVMALRGMDLRPPVADPELDEIVIE